MTEENKTPEEETKDVVDMYYGENKITNVEDDISMEGYKRVTVEFEKPIKNEDGSEDTHEKFSIPAWELAACTLERKGNLNDLMNGRCNHIVLKILELFKEKDFRVEDLQFVIQKLLDSVSGIEAEVELGNFKVSDKSDIRISHWDKVLERDKDEDEAPV